MEVMDGALLQMWPFCNSFNIGVHFLLLNEKSVYDILEKFFAWLFTQLLFSSHPPVYCTWTWFYWVKPPAFVYLCCCSLCVSLVLVVSMSIWFHFHACADWHHSRIYSLLWLPRGWDGKTCPWSQPGKSAMTIASFGTLFWIVDHQ